MPKRSNQQASRHIRHVFVAAAVAFGFTLPFAAQPTPADAPSLAWPVDCKLGETCWIARYVDRSTGKGRLDYSCGKRTQDGHDGTDIALADNEAMRRGVAVKAAADGIVIRLRDDMEDGLLQQEDPAAIDKRGCGNTLIIRHAGGWQTQYCHLAHESLLVERGDSVRAGEPIAQVGFSGKTEFPHLHFTVWAPRQTRPVTRNIDPFDSGAFEDGNCATEGRQLWENNVSYQETALMPPVIDTARRNRGNMWEAQPTTLPSNSPSLVVQARGFHTLAGDIWRIRLIDPTGRVRVEEEISQRRDRQRILAFAGMEKPPRGFTSGVRRAEVQLVRAQHTIGSMSSTVTIK